MLHCGLPTAVPLALLLLALGASGSPALAAAAQAKPPLDVHASRNGLYGNYEARQRDIGRRLIRYDAEGNVIQDQAYRQAVAENDRSFQRMMDEARALEARRQSELARLNASAAHVAVRRNGDYQPFDNTGTGPKDPGSRGVWGDHDLTFNREADYRRFLEAARRRGYTVAAQPGQNGAYIKELDISMWQPQAPALPGSPAEHANRALHAENHEAARARDPLGRTADNIKKIEHDLPKDPRQLRGRHRQEWITNTSKGAERILDVQIEEAQRGPGGPVQEQRVQELQARRQRFEQIRRMQARRRGGSTLWGPARPSGPGASKDTPMPCGGPRRKASRPLGSRAGGSWAS